MHVYRIDERSAPKLKLTPRVPINRLCDEDADTKRVCAAPSIRGCIRALVSGANNKDRIYEISYEKFVKMIKSGKHNRHLKDWNVYEADVEDELIIRPTVKQLPDVRSSREVWIPEPTVFLRTGKLAILDSRPGDHTYWTFVPKP